MRQFCQTEYHGTFCPEKKTGQDNLKIFDSHLETVNDEVDGAVDDDEEMGKSHHNVHPGGPELVRVAV